MQTELPEARLLNLIRRKAKTSLDTQRRKFKLGSRFSFKFFQKLLSENPAVSPEFLTAAQKVLKLILLGLAACLILTFIFPLFWERKLANLAVSGSGSEEFLPQKPEGIEPQATDYAVYLKDIGSKQLFETNFAEGELQAESEINLSDKFSLVGIISSDNPQAVIEDKQAQKTYYLREGESFSGIKVEQINEGKVRINYHGRQAELFL